MRNSCKQSLVVDELRCEMCLAKGHVNVRLELMNVSRTEALRIFNEHYRSPGLKIYAVGDTNVKGPERDPIFRRIPNAWYVRFSLQNAPMIGPSRLVCISKVNGQMLFDGHACDEG